MNVERSTILITGGASGIGESMAIMLANIGAKKIYISDLNIEKGEALQSKYPGVIVFIKCDVTSDTEMKALFGKIASNGDVVDILITSAGVGAGELIARKRRDRVVAHTNNSFSFVNDINVYGSFLAVKYMSKHLIDNIVKTKNQNNENNGCIILISSIASREGQIGQTAYGASKGAASAMVLPMARDLGRYNIRVNAIEPGVTETPLITNFPDDRVTKNIISATPLKRIGKPEEIAHGAKFIIQNSFLNGSRLRIDGGVRVPMF